MRIGLQVPRFTWPNAPSSIGPKLAEIGKTADEAGFASIWVMDHFFQIGVVGQPEEPMLEKLKREPKPTPKLERNALPAGETNRQRRSNEELEAANQAPPLQPTA